MSHTRHFLTLNDLNRDELLALLKRASELKLFSEAVSRTIL